MTKILTPQQAKETMFVNCTVEHKMKEGIAINSNNSWYSRGELPPVGVECEAEYNGKWVKCTVIHHANNGVANLAACKMPQHAGSDVGNLAWFDIFRPIKSERERFVEAAIAIFYNGTHCERMAEALYEAGFRAPD